MHIPSKRLRLYLETSVWNFVYADDAPEKRDATKAFFEEVRQGKFDIYISGLVIFEIGQNVKDPSKKEKLETLIRDFAPVQLRQNEEVENLTNAYVEAKIGPSKAKPDMIHIAHATAHDLDVIVSWNLKHIVRLKTKMLVNGINKSLGYKEIQIVTPEEVPGYGS